jgi:hypothetical protein
MAGVLVPLWRPCHRIAEAQQVDQLVTGSHGRTAKDEYQTGNWHPVCARVKL